VWCVNASNQIWSWNGSGWQQMPGTAQCVSVGNRHNVWVANPAGILHWWDQDAQSWHATDGNANQISAGEDGSVCCVNASQQIYIRRGGFRGQWEMLPGAATCVSCHDQDTIVVVNAGHQMFSWNHLSRSWQQQPGTAQWASVGNHGYGHVWCVNPAGMPHRHRGAFPYAGDFNVAFTHVGGILTKVSAGGKDNVWGVNPNGDIWRFVNGAWQHMPGNAHTISAASDGSVWCVNASQQLWHWNGSGWEQISGTAVSVSTGGKYNTWCVNPAGIPHHWNHNTRSWQAIDGSLTQVSAGEDGTVFGVNASQQLWIRRGGLTGRWEQLPGAAVQVSGHDEWSIACVNAAGMIHTWNAAISNWKHQPGDAKWCSVGGPGCSTLWVVNASGMPHRHGH